MRPSYFDPVAQPDTETQYRHGGKVNKMQKFSVAKKMPRKFQAGGKATAPQPSPKGGPKELQDEAEKMRQAKLDEAQRKAGERRPNLGKLGFKKGGSVRKFADGGETTAEDKDVSYDMSSESKPRFGADTYARAQKFLEAGKKSDSVATKATYKPSPKKVSTVKVGAKPAPAKSSDYGNESRRMTEAPKRAGVIGSFDKESKAAEDKQTPDSGTDVNSRLKKAFSNIDLGYLTRPNKALYKKGGTVKKFAKGGGIEVKGKTRGKVC